MAPQNQSAHVARSGEELGVWTISEIRELLATGFLLPSDDYWIKGQKDWQPLSQLPPDAPAEVSTVSKVVGTMTDAAKVFGRGTIRVAEKVTTAAGKQRAEMTAASNRLLEGFLPRLRAQIQTSLASTSHSIESALRDEVFMRKLFGAAYDCLPKPVTRFVTEEAFIEFCHKHRERLLVK